MTAKKPQAKPVVKEETVEPEEVVESDVTDVKEETTVTEEVADVVETPEISVTKEDSAATESEEDQSDMSPEPSAEEPKVDVPHKSKNDPTIVELVKTPWYDTPGLAKNGISPHNKFEELLTGKFEIFASKNDGCVQVVAGNTLVWLAAADVRKFI